MTLYVKGYYFNGANFSLVYNQNEGERIYLDQIRSPSQSYAAVFLRESTDTDNTVIHLFRNDGTQVYRLAVGEPAKQWAVSDAGEVLIYTEVPSGDEVEKIIRCYNSAGSEKWHVTLTGILDNQTVAAVGIGTEYASVVYSDTVRFYDVDTGTNTKIVQPAQITGREAPPFYNMRYSSSGRWIAYVYPGYHSLTITFVKSDGTYFQRTRNLDIQPSNRCILSADAACSRVLITGRDGVHNSWRPTLFYRDTSTYISFDYWAGGEGSPRGQAISPCGSWLTKDSTLYQIKADGIEEFKSIAWASGESGCWDCDLSYYGRYLLVRHDSGKVWAYDFEDEIELDYVENPLKSKVIILCAD
ncbi:MAG: hypothetical protein DRP09_21455 [Candidatus Thorarchaeota archaeon]|nr:MAG: hypothetical protein DRP09_21455 [Candidatus Thorarchaeota archaeon]